MKLWDDSYKTDLNEIQNHIRRNYQDYSSESIFDLADDIFIDAAIVKSWWYLDYLYNHNNDDLNEYTPYIKSKQGANGRPYLEDLKTNKVGFLIKVLRVIYEFQFWAGDRDDYNDIFSPGVLYKLSTIVTDAHSARSLLWIEHSLATTIVKNFIHSHEIKSIINISRDIDDYEKKIVTLKENTVTSFNNEFERLKINIVNLIDAANSSQKDLETYEAKLNEHKTQYNFTLLSRAFNNLANDKKKELKYIRRLTWIFTGILTIPPVFTFMNHIFHWINVGEGMLSLTYYLPLLTFELLVFYFMRLYYGEARTINTQLLQIEHRLSLCEFIQDYIEKKNSDKDNKTSWDLFESLIFSPIQVTPDNIPSVIDGANAVADIAGKIMSKSKN